MSCRLTSVLPCHITFKKKKKKQQQQQSVIHGFCNSHVILDENPNKLLIFWENTHTTPPKQSQLGQNSREKGWGTKGRDIQLYKQWSLCSRIYILSFISFLLIKILLTKWKRGKRKINFYIREQNRAPNARNPSNNEVGKGVRRSQNIRCTPLHLEHPRQELRVLIFQNLDHSDCNLAPAHNESPEPIFLVETNTTSTLWSLHTIATSKLRNFSRPLQN